MTTTTQAVPSIENLDQPPADYEYNLDNAWGVMADAVGKEMDNDYSNEEAAGGMDHSMHMGHSMAMNFHGDHSGLVYLFDGLSISSQSHLLWYSVLTFLLGIVVEFIKDYSQFKNKNLTCSNIFRSILTKFDQFCRSMGLIFA